ncbi:hypothetical protein CAF53_25915 (plasmid) [Sphingobium sp. LB126]|uniref:hypothetical protein n=1 Tax=Sphingobium sp. LB126 TaxID=1983755 RepID=UPI000C1FE59B|nr:hypothetical protein [Sphingobium sp. LB126]PJG45059.1 hypothetical protein CAF53_25915 [Sphingobium sp. LB126]
MVEAGDAMGVVVCRRVAMRCCFALLPIAGRPGMSDRIGRSMAQRLSARGQTLACPRALANQLK